MPAMAAQLVVLNGRDKDRSFPIIAGTPLVIGRGESRNTDLVDLYVSRNHCEVCLEHDQVRLTDSGSSGGTFVNGQRVTMRYLQVDDRIRVGETVLRFVYGSVVEKTVPPAPIVFARKRRGQEIPWWLQPLLGQIGKAMGRYQILEILGFGTIGVVFQALDTRSQEIVALRVLKPDFAKDPKARERFKRGINLVRTLNHPNLVGLDLAGVTHGLPGIPDDLCWMAQEYIEGESLAQAMKAGPMDWPRAWQVAVDIGKALGYLHDQGVMHRNVMPPNIMIRNADHCAKLGDVILAKLLEENEAEQLTMPGELVGNVYYLAPERIGAKDDNRADLWSLGVTIYEMLAGHRPFQQPDLINKILTAKPESLRKLQPALPAAFEAIVMKLLAKRPEDRYQTAAQLLADLDKVQPPH